MSSLYAKPDANGVDQPCTVAEWVAWATSNGVPVSQNVLDDLDAANAAQVGG